jgi:hypothetical protein
MRAMNGNDPFPSIGWPVDRPYLAGLIEFGLSDARIAGCFAVDHSEVRLLRERYKLDPASENGILQARIDTSTALALDELSNAVLAAVAYVSSAIKCAKRDATPSTTNILLMEKSLEQLLRIGKAYQSLQISIRPAAEYPSERLI